MWVKFILWEQLGRVVLPFFRPLLLTGSIEWTAELEYQTGHHRQSCVGNKNWNCRMCSKLELRCTSIAEQEPRTGIAKGGDLRIEEQRYNNVRPGTGLARGLLARIEVHWHSYQGGRMLISHSTHSHFPSLKASTISFSLQQELNSLTHILTKSF